MKRKSLGLLAFAPLALVAIAGCSDDAADDAALDGKGGSCTVKDLGNGTSEIRCPDDTSVIIDNGRTGAPGREGEKGRDGRDGASGKDGKDGKDVQSPCVLTDNPDGTHSLTCGGKSVVIGAPCEDGFPGDVIVTDPEYGESMMLTLFQVTSCTWVRGDVIAVEYPGDELPKALARIEKVDGDLVIAENEALTTVAFPALQTVGGDLVFAGNPELVETGAFPKLTSAKSLVWYQNEALETVGAFPKLETVEDLIWIDVPLLTATPAFPELVSVGKDLGWANNASLEAIGGFPKLESVESLEVKENAALTDLAGLSALTRITADLTITDNALLASLEALEGLTEVGGDFTIIDNPSLPQCEIDALIDLIEDADGIGGTTTTSGNDEDAVCAP